jgi:site-specific DNA recombinase
VNVMGYVRVSTEDQAREGVSLDAQEHRLHAYCQAKGWQLVAVVRDEGKSAKDMNRPGLQRILADLAKRRRGWDALVVVKLDRLTRSVRDLGELTAAFRRSKVAFVSLDESVDTGSAAGELFLNVVASISQWERRAIGERTASAMAHLKAKGQRVSRQAAYGFRLAAGGRVVVDQGEQGHPPADRSATGRWHLATSHLPPTRGAGHPGPERAGFRPADAGADCQSGSPDGQRGGVAEITNGPGRPRSATTSLERLTVYNCRGKLRRAWASPDGSRRLQSARSWHPSEAKTLSGGAI